MAKYQTQQSEECEIWQWNCRGFRRKRGQLLQLVVSQQRPPAVIAVQEAGTHPKLRGYETYSTGDAEWKVATLVDNAITAIRHKPIEGTDIPHLITEIAYKGSHGKSAFVLNIYSPPRQKKATFDKLFQETAKLAKGNPLIIVGDFNARHASWGYKIQDTKGQNIARQIEALGMTLLTDPAIPTRTGNTISMDTSPDLTIVQNCHSVDWCNTIENLGSDHYILSTTIRTGRIRKHIGTAKITDWHAYRKSLKGHMTAIDDLDEWCKVIRNEKQMHTKTVARTDDTPEVDAHLLHLWEARRNLTKRWKRQKRNKKLKAKIKEITQQAEEYANQLATANWEQFCDSLNGTLGTAKTWNILRAMIDPLKTKREGQKSLERLLHTYPGTRDDLLRDIYTKCFGAQAITAPYQAKYTGFPNSELDAPFTHAEVRAAIVSMKRNTAPGADQITNAMIRNMNDEAITALLNFINKHWVNGTIPQQWKHAVIIMIPKPGKKLAIENLRPISLTSCLGKVFERLINTRLQRHLEQNNLLPNTMFGFRPNLSTQDILLLLKEEVLTNVPTAGENIVMAIDIKGAFDNVSHKAILDGLAETNCGQRTYQYVQNFLTKRTAVIKVGEDESKVFHPPSKGTPQGAVISPTLFNIAMIGLARKLEDIPDIRHSFYADDITIWTTKGSLAEKEERLQFAAKTIEEYTRERGLQCSADKSELIRFSKSKKQRTDPSLRLEVKLEGNIIPEKTTVRILGMWLQSNQRCLHTLNMIKRTAQQIVRMIVRITNNRAGLKEQDALRLVKSLVISRLTYSLPYHNMNKEEKEKADKIIRMAYKAALRLPQSTSTAKLLALGLHNTFDELAEAQVTTQINRLLQTPTGRELLQRIGLGGQVQAHGRAKELSCLVRAWYKICPLPKNMDPILHAGRRKARAAYIDKKTKYLNTARFTDAAPYQTNAKNMVAVVTDRKGNITSCASIAQASITEAEEIALALAIKEGRERKAPLTIITDSKAACRNYERGRICTKAFQILTKAPRDFPIEYTQTIIWAPGHAGVTGNQFADEAARGFTNHRASLHTAIEDPTPLDPNFATILQYYRENRKLYPAPHKNLTAMESAALRRLQTNTYTNLHRLHVFYPTAYRDICPWCGAPPTLFHITWECTLHNEEHHNMNNTEEKWEALLSSSAFDDQLCLIQRAEKMARASGALE